jgi:hypothetical protein
MKSGARSEWKGTEEVGGRVSQRRIAFFRQPPPFPRHRPVAKTPHTAGGRQQRDWYSNRSCLFLPESKLHTNRSRGETCGPRPVDPDPWFAALFFRLEGGGGDAVMRTGLGDSIENLLTMKGIGQAFVLVGVVIGLDSAGMGPAGAIGAAVGIVAMLIGVVLIRKSKPKS